MRSRIEQMGYSSLTIEMAKYYIEELVSKWDIFSLVNVVL